ncbi:MAG: hypothetical protein QNL62_12525 [Gammaproteobacteria bacterium]|nr:hypothetical protein [Gammaproteobacteria bacterium]
MTPKTALFLSNTVMLLCIVTVNALLFHFWPSWHDNSTSIEVKDDHVFYMIWVALPYSLLFITNFFIQDSVNALMFLVISALFFLGINVLNYYYYMAVLSDGSSGLIFIVLPFLQLFGTLVLIVIASIINGVKHRQ